LQLLSIGILMRDIRTVIFVVLSMGLLSQPAWAEKRVALVLGNSAYQNVTPLTNPTNDSIAIAETFQKAGFDIVDLKRNLGVNETRRALRDFSDKVRDADVAVVYFAGHGMEIDGTNYVIPVDAALERDIDAFDEAIPLDRILAVIEPAKVLRLVILDACRDNPFSKTMKRTIGSRSIGRGLAKVEPNSPNTLIAFAAKAGSTASDGDGNNSPFTTALIKYLPRPGLDLRRVFGFARDDVLRMTRNKQEPFVYGSLGGEDVSLVPDTIAPGLGSASDSNAAIRRDYELAERIGAKAVWDSFITNYPSGFYNDLAKAQRDRLAAEDTAKLEKRSPLTEKSRTADQEPKDDKPIGSVAALTPTDRADDTAAKASQINAAELPRLLQIELQRVGCGPTTPDGAWNASAQRAMNLFNRNAKVNFDVKTASLEALDGVRSKSARICPLLCEHGYKADGERCVEIVCKSGFEVGDDNTCERIQSTKPTARRAKPEQSARPERTPEVVTRPKPNPELAGNAKPSMSGLYAQCRAQAIARGGNGHNFARMDACARNGGRF
jgi:uncharacterized caspase-like protein